VELGVDSRDLTKSKHHLASEPIALHLQNTCSIHACRPNTQLSPGMDVGRAMGNLTAQANPRCISLAHRIRATQRLVFPLICCNTSFPGATSVFETGASAYSLLAIFDSRLHSHCCHRRQQKSPSTKGFERDCRLHLSGWAHAAAPFSSCIASSATQQLAPACRTSFNGHPGQSGQPRRSRDPLLLPEAVVSHHDCTISPSLVNCQAIRALPSSYLQWANQCSPWRGVRILKWFCPMLGHPEPL
jgi:hypothetical protein